MARLSLLRVYDEAMRAFVRGRVRGVVVYPDTEGGKPYIKPVENFVTLGTAERPYGFDVPYITEPGTGKHIDTERMTSMLQTPRVTITRGNMFFDMARNNSRPVRNMQFWDPAKRYRVFAQAIKPWNIQYTIDIRAWLRNDAQALVEWWMFHSTPHVVFKIDFGYPWGEKGISLRVSEVLDLTNYEPGEDFRYIWYQIPLMMEAYTFEGFENPSDLPQHALDPEAPTSRRRTVQAVKVRVFECSAPTVPLIEEMIEVVPPAPKPEEDFC